MYSLCNRNKPTSFDDYKHVNDINNIADDNSILQLNSKTQ